MSGTEGAAASRSSKSGESGDPAKLSESSESARVRRPSESAKLRRREPAKSSESGKPGKPSDSGKSRRPSESAKLSRREPAKSSESGKPGKPNESAELRRPSESKPGEPSESGKPGKSSESGKLGEPSAPGKQVDADAAPAEEEVLFSDRAAGPDEPSEAAGPALPDVDLSFSDVRELPDEPEVEASEGEAEADDLEVSFDDDREVSAPLERPAPKAAPEAHGLTFSDSHGGEPAAAAPAQDAKRPRSSGRMRALTSGGRNRTLTPKAAQELKRRERSPEEEAAAQAAVEAQIQPPPEDDPYVGKEIGPFKVQAFLGLDRGVRRYLARDEESHEPSLLRVYALKGSYGDELTRLATRAERVVRAANPGISICLGAGRVKDAFFAGHELPLGPRLSELIAQGIRLEEEEILTLIEQIASGLSTLHTRDLVHGDVSIETIRRERPGSFVLCESGLGRVRPELSFLSAGGDVVGSPGFLAPEVVDSGKVVPNAELYSLGCVAWTLVSGAPPFGGADAVQSLLDQLNQELPPPQPPAGEVFSPQLLLLIAKLTGYTPSERYANVADVLSDIRKVRAGEEPVPFAKTIERSEDTAVAGRLRPGTILLIALVVLDAVLLLVAAIALTKYTQASLPDPTSGLRLPLPGITEGGYGRN